MKIIAMLNQKGGVAKTTSTRNIATALEKFGKKVLLVDLDPQANLTSSFNLDKRALKFTIYDLFQEEVNKTNDLNVKEVLINYGNISLLPTNIKMARTDLKYGHIRLREFILKNIFKNVSSHEYDYCLIDCPPQLSLLTDNALALADKIYIPVEAEGFSLEGIDDLLDTIKEIRQEINPTLELGGVFITRAKTQTNLHSTLIKELENFFKGDILSTIIRENIKVGEATAMKQSVVTYDPKSNGAIDYLNLTKEIIGREE